MSAGSSGARRILRLTSTISRSCPAVLLTQLHPASFARDANICLQCRHTYRRGFASAAAAQTEEASSQLSDPIPAVQSSQAAYAINAGLLLSRPPQITRDLTSFEKAFYLYQRRLNERLALPFTQYFYFRRGTPADTHWKAKRRERGGVAARDVGEYNAYSKEGWNDEVLANEQISEPEEQVKALLDDDGKAETLGGVSSRITEADKAKDEKSLNRLLQRTLYLMVKNREGRWSFPATRVHGKENLRQVRLSFLLLSMQDLGLTD